MIYADEKIAVDVRALVGVARTYKGFVLHYKGADTPCYPIEYESEAVAGAAYKALIQLWVSYSDLIFEGEPE